METESGDFMCGEGTGANGPLSLGLEEKYEKALRRIEALESENAILVTNISCLYRTAKKEIQRLRRALDECRQKELPEEPASASSLSADAFTEGAMEDISPSGNEGDGEGEREEEYSQPSVHPPFGNRHPPPCEDPGRPNWRPPVPSQGQWPSLGERVASPSEQTGWTGRGWQWKEGPSKEERPQQRKRAAPPKAGERGGGGQWKEVPGKEDRRENGKRAAPSSDQTVAQGGWKWKEGPTREENSRDGNKTAVSAKHSGGG
eukprot:Cvel_20477.t1-p1 / transcript=Cvel_20477.t1 / gene=Cvel_20477 / organism=Chromera_velia_CCMP2878 / gene_product=hypothetical protein / transcript_product=hypothetical protein / location=Cvel_scaffold1840:1-782(-) / protein_length=260 / sequence_SO=supercontig / SO=protein_coding / is_pseudo=false